MSYRKHLWNHFLVYFFAFFASFAILSRALKIKRRTGQKLSVCAHQAVMDFYRDWHPKIAKFVER